MQNVQNAAEIQQRVINLVELYRTKVGKESKIAKDAKAEKDYWDQENINIAMDAHDAGLSAFGYMTPDMPEEWINTLKVNEHLIGHFYSEVAGNDADKDVLSHFLSDYYDSSIFTQEEEAFLRSHFKEMMNYIILTPCDESLELVNLFDRKDINLIPKEVLELVTSRISIPDGATIYNPFTGFAQLTSFYPGHKFFCEESYEVFNRRWNAFCDAANLSDKVKNIGLLQAWMKVALYANNIDVEVIENGEIPSSFDAVLSFLPQVPQIEENDAFAKMSQIEGLTVASRIASAYRNLKEGGVMGLLIPCNQLYENEKRSSQFKAFLDSLIKDGDMSEIIQLPQVMSNNIDFETFCLLIAKKGRKENDIVFIDARCCSHVIENSKHYMCSFDVSEFKTLLENDGKDSMGFRHIVKVSSDNLVQDILVPQVYTVDRPSNTENPIPLSNLCVLESNQIRDVQFDLPEDTPWVTQNDLTPLYTGDLDVSDVRKADCPNNPTYVEGSEDYAFDKEGKFVDSIWSQMYTKKGHRVLDYRLCTYLNGNCDAVLYNQSAEYGIQVAVVRATGKPYAVSSGILVLCPNDDFDANSLAALLRLPIVYRQLIAYQEYGLSNHLNDILVPTDKRIIGDELYRMKREESVTNELGNKFAVAQKKHKEKLEDYQHAMRKHIREISSSVRRMERFINDMDTSEDVKTFLNDRLAVIKTHRLYLSEDIERLNEENTYGEASPFDIDHSLRNYREYFGSDVCPIKYTNEIANDAIRQYRIDHHEELKGLDEKSKNKRMEVAFAEGSLAYVDIAEYNFGKIVRNILENAKKHGFDDFTDVNRKDCVIEVALNWDKERQMYRIDFRNNGNPLPEGLTKASYGENRKYAGKTGGTGIGGYEVAENVRHYNGDYAISQDGDWVVVSIYLPKSKIYGERL